MTTLDPNIGYTNGSSRWGDFFQRIPGFLIHPSRFESPLSIVALGGSTTDQLITYNEERNDFRWPYYLQTLCDEKKRGCTLYNGGVGGYTSNQELLKLLRDVIPLRPDIIVALEGVNELYHSPADPWPFVNGYQQYLFQILTEDNFPILPNTILLLKRLTRKMMGKKSVTDVSYGYSLKNPLSASENWELNFRNMRAIAESNGIKFLVVLQPIFGFGTYAASAEETAKWKLDENYRKNLNQFYSQAPAICKKYSYCLDLSDVFGGMKNLFFDPRHPNTQGDKIIAKRIHEALVSRNWIR